MNSKEGKFFKRVGSKLSTIFKSKKEKEDPRLVNVDEEKIK